MLFCDVEISTYWVHTSVFSTDSLNEVSWISWKQSIFKWNKVTNFLFNYIFLMKITDTHFSILFIWVTGLKEESRKTNEMVYIFLCCWGKNKKKKSHDINSFYCICNGKNCENNPSISISLSLETYHKFFEAWKRSVNVLFSDKLHK